MTGVARVTGDVNGTVLFRLFGSLLGEISGHRIVRSLTFHQVHRDRRELQRCATLQEENLMCFRNMQHAAEFFLGI